MRHDPRGHRRRLGDVAAVRKLLVCRPAGSDGTVLPAARLGLPKVPARAALRVRSRRGDFHRVRLFLFVLVGLAEARGRLRGDDQRPAVARAGRASSSSWPATMATCCSTSSSAAFRGWASSRPPTSPRSREQRGVDTLVPFFDERPGRHASRPRGEQPTWCSGTTCSRRCPTSTRSSPASAIVAEADRDRRRSSFPHLHAALRGQPVRHHLSRALLVFLAAQRARRSSRVTTHDLRRRRALDPRGLAAHLRAARGR